MAPSPSASKTFQRTSTCQCGHPTKDRHHIIYDCPIWENIRKDSVLITLVHGWGLSLLQPRRLRPGFLGVMGRNCFRSTEHRFRMPPGRTFTFLNLPKTCVQLIFGRPTRCHHRKQSKHPLYASILFDRDDSNGGFIPPTRCEAGGAKQNIEK
ncbi:hypothetical protein CEXT_513841 [Caerostris extrusa]|uniref:Reverse transcriptase zinc-binding domain-containing protein n=1 Tax=Caerostris extrusa TaxID=172846 RepID=A0AAV4UXG4_CAEEX|nr:hypothetical protein CEXT_513841 [Caerostris extrusa]